MKINNIKTISLCLSIAVISGCAQSPGSTVVFDSQEGALNELKNISIEARDELRLLAKAQESKSQRGLTREQHEQRYFQAVNVPAGFERRLDFNYTGPSVKAAEAIAMMAGYKFKIYGKPFAQEPWVRIALKNQPLNDGLKEIGLQTGDSIVVEIHPAAKLMRFVYKEQ